MYKRLVPRFTLLVGISAGLAGPPYLIGQATAASGVPSQETGPMDEPLNEQQIQALVRQLGDKSFRARQRATQELTRIGVHAKQALLAALADPDAEIRFRARHILVSVLDSDFDLQLAAFAADVDGKQEHDLPGWTRFRELAGDDRAARLLFVEMQHAERGLLQSEESSPETVGDLLDTRTQQLQQRMQDQDAAQRKQPSLASISALLLVATNERVQVSTQAGSYLCNFAYQNTFQQAMLEQRRSRPLHKLLAKWVQRDFGADATVSYQTLMLALRYDLKEGVQPALAVVQGAAIQPHMRQYGILALAKLGGKDYIQALEPLLEDESACASRTVGDAQVDTQIRDVALAALLHITGQDLATYGFADVQEIPMLLYNTATLGFADDETRQKALKHWTEWSAKNKP